MKTKIKKLFILVVFNLFNLIMYGQYTETMNTKGLKKNLRDDYGLVNDNAATDQSSKLLMAITDLNDQGGGIVVIPTGTYNFSAVNLKSNVHILIKVGTIIKPNLGDPVFIFDPEKTPAKSTRDYIENVSVRGIGGAFTIDYHDRKSDDKQRALLIKMVKNFLVSNMIVKDNYSTYCGITLAPSDEKVEDVSNWAVSRPTDGIIRNICHFRASPGYGLVQCHGAQSVHFNNLYSLGGVALRLEVGADNKNVGVYDITANNITCENGKAALLMGPHSAKNGIVTVDGLTGISCERVFSMGDGHVKKGAPDQTPGWFDSRSSVKNIHAIFGTEAQFKSNSILDIPDTKYYDVMKIWSDGKFFSGPSITAVTNNATSYTVSIKNITMEGFPYNKDKPILAEGEGARPGSWGIEKKLWVNTHKGRQWKSDKGVVNDDYTAYSCSVATSEKTTDKQSLVDNLNDSLNKIMVYPNPIRDNATVSGLQIGDKVIVYDFSGNKKLQFKAKSENEVVDFSTLKEGTYFVSINGNKGIQVIKK